MNKKIDNLFISVSSDHVFCIAGEDYFSLPYNDLERTFPEFLKKHIEQFSPQKLIVLNGPGGFTSLRIGALTIQMITKHYNIDCYQWTKTDFYHRFYDQGVLPRFMWIYIGQKNNLWLYDFKDNKYEKVHISGLQEYLKKIEAIGAEYSVDFIHEHNFLANTEGKEDEAKKKNTSGLLNPKNMITLQGVIGKSREDSGVSVVNSGILLTYKNIKASLSYNTLTSKKHFREIIKPVYLIEPTLS